MKMAYKMQIQLQESKWYNFFWLKVYFGTKCKFEDIYHQIVYLKILYGKFILFFFAFCSAQTQPGSAFCSVSFMEHFAFCRGAYLGPADYGLQSLGPGPLGQFQRRFK